MEAMRWISRALYVGDAFSYSFQKSILGSLDPIDSLCRVQGCSCRASQAVQSIPGYTEYPSCTGCPRLYRVFEAEQSVLAGA